MTRETVHIISHSHWDREWYLPFEEHRMRLVTLIDDLCELFETDEAFKSFHLDGQLIALDDYLAIRPHKREQLARYIREGKLIVGPFYILQDDYLISSEANVRNTLIGHLECLQWGRPPKIGYFPDTFGNMGQTPQLLKQAGIEVAFFGRGVKPIGFDNQVLSDEQFQSQFSEMIWTGADGSQILGILFANWYSNGNEIPADREEAKRFWDKKLEDARKYAATPHLLMMNGCDHQPVQKNLSEAIRVARELYPDIDFVHSNFEDYIAAVRNSLPEQLSQVRGELTSQETDGWYTLANTASSRIYLKQANDKASQLLEQVVEPLVVLTGEPYPKDEMRYAWKLLLENAPHDSICGCSVDAVHREMMTRFEKVEQVGNYLAEKTFTNWSRTLDTKDLDGYLFTVVNTSASPQTKLVTVEVIVDETDFRDGRLAEHHQKMADITLPPLGLFTVDGERIWAEIEDLGVQFDYHLPTDAFRSAVFARKLRVSFVAEDMPAFSWQTYQIKPASALPKVEGSDHLENDFVRLERDGDHLVLTHKELGHRITNLITFEDVGDIGNEYAHFAPKSSQPIYSRLIDFTISEETPTYQRAMAKHQIIIPIGADETLYQEQKQLIEYYKRQAGRSQQMASLEVTTEITLYRKSPQLSFTTRFDNHMLDHRLRVIIETGLQAETHLADSIFEVVERPNTPSVNWENPHHPQRHRTFISLDNNTIGMTVSSIGLHEYEILDKSKIALTLLRSVGELGDWGDFPTPEAQCLGVSEVHYGIEVHSKTMHYEAIHRAQTLQLPLYVGQVTRQEGGCPSTGQFKHPVLEKPELYVTALKPSEETGLPLLRYYNLSDEALEITHQAKGVDLLEQPVGELPQKIGPQEIRTEILSQVFPR
ncbi:alpha-mannosidase [Streptococcus hillyeri]|uniref:Alpha-mannosidase n=1 Tax=Streptococcus hillyeri TaxID=2282420 RepID=A0A3L9E051_9STRE|nr:alpha-mannosidase [Streptococcus hillyeri]RLY05339.1 alpha-mannosidase [Streptococcus hillyeri]